MTEEIKFKLSSEDSSILSKVFGPVNANINQIQDSLGIKVKSRGNSFSLVGKTEAIKAGKEVIETLHLKAEKSELIRLEKSTYLSEKLNQQAIKLIQKIY